MARKILLADDSVTAQNMGRKILADAGYEVITVNNGSAALKKISEHRPDLIVLDVYMPGYSGLEVCQRLKEVAETARIPVLLTVGKLEPFKTDEAKRVRADGFIVKPFEASELLSALSKLEDKIVPRAEASKPGRLARANAAIDEGRDKAVAADEDSGWKNRISFPSKKKEAAAETNPDDPAVYNPVNKDLRTTIDHHRPSETPKPKDEERVDLGALAPEGLPKDVTPEEIAALAAAAAQVQGTILESKAEARDEVQTSAPAEFKPNAPETTPQASAVDNVQEETSATFAEQSSEVKPAVFELIAAENVQLSDAPITMAAAAGVETGSGSCHWSAVAVALAPEDQGISLEQEMQQAYAVFAAAESAHSASIATSPSTELGEAVLPANSPEAAASETIHAVPATVAPEAAQAMAEVASAATETISAAVKEFEHVAGSYVQDSPTATELSPSEASQFTSELAPTTPASEEQSPVAIADDPSLSKANPEPQLHQTEERIAVEESKLSVAPASIESDSAVSEAPQADISPEPISSDPASVSESDIKSEHSGEKKESDIAATTAAAWASWRRIRESGDSSSSVHSEHSQNEKVSDSHDAAAMAVAAGAENTPEDAGAFDESDPAIASIIDSVLADLRPKIVEEISRKLGKKK